MSAANELTKLTAAQMADAVAAGEISAVELTQAHLDHISLTDVHIHAFLHVAAESAVAAAQAVDDRRAAGRPLGPLAGVPLRLKDVLTTADMTTTRGSTILASRQPPYDAAQTPGPRDD